MRYRLECMDPNKKKEYIHECNVESKNLKWALILIIIMVVLIIAMICTHEW